MAVQQHQPAALLLGGLGAAQDVVGRHGGVAVDVAVSVLRGDHRGDQCCGARQARGGTVGGEAQVFLAVVTCEQADEGLLGRVGHGD